MISELLTVFQFCCCAGWLIEVIYRSIYQKRFVNPGFLLGPWLPLYGFGGTVVYFLCKTEIAVFSSFVSVMLFFFSSCIIMTVLEGVAGLIFLYIFDTRLWNYSDIPLNFKGVVCPQYSVIWGIVCIMFRLIIYRPLSAFVADVASEAVVVFISGMWMGIFIVDLCYSFDLAQKLKHYAQSQKTVVHIEKLKSEIYDHAKKLRTLPKLHFFRGRGMLRKHIEKILSELNDKNH